MVIVWMIIMDV